MADEFYGRSYGLHYGLNVDGEPIDSFWNLSYHFDGRSETVAAGESFTIGAYASWSSELEGINNLEISWVIECGAASNGTLELFSGLDPEWNEDPDRATESLGVVQVSGEQTVVSRTASVTALDLYSQDDEVVVWVKCLSGSVEIVQVKLRAWPTTGPRGGWARAPGAVAENLAAEVRQPPQPQGVSIGSSDPADGDPEERSARYFGETRAAVGAQYTNIFEPTRSATGGLALSEFHRHTIRNWGAAGTTGPVYSYIVAREDWYTSPPLPDGAGQDPREVFAEGGYRDRDGRFTPLNPTFVQWQGSVLAAAEWFQVEGGGKTPPTVEGLLVFGSGSNFDPKTNNALHVPPLPSGLTRSIPMLEEGTPFELRDAPGPVVSISVTLALQGVSVPALLAARNSTDSTERYGGGAYGVVRDPDDPIAWVGSFPEFMWWDPSLPWQDDDKPVPRFFWKDDLDNWRAIGPGKPADDLVLFKIKTAMGIYSEPRPGDEPGVGAHPLRVKVDTGYGADMWDTPVWMEPQD